MAAKNMGFHPNTKRDLYVSVVVVVVVVVVVGVEKWKF